MVKFLINRPIAVSMTVFAVLVFGIVAGKLIPVSLMPDIDIPQVTVQVSSRNASARQLENTVVSQLRNQLIQVSHLSDIKSETRDGKGIISLWFKYGADIDFAFIEVNEKIDRTMSSFPRDVSRPTVVKTGATDIPVYYLNLTPRKSEEGSSGKSIEKDLEGLFPVSQKFVELSRFANQVIRKRLEQLPEVAIADVSGSVHAELMVIPDMEKLQALELGLNQLEEVIRTSNVNLGSVLIRDGIYQFNIRFNETLSNKSDIENIFIRVEDRLLQVKDIARVIEHPQKRKGLVTTNGKDALTIAIIKQSDARMAALKAKLDNLIDQFHRDYPDIEFEVTRDQTQLLEYSISNLQQNLTWGAFLAFLVMFLFLKDFKAPFLVGVSMPISLVISLLFFYLMDISINIISLSGLVLGLGMMIDNSIIVIDNITQYREQRRSLVDSCILGTNEIITPMLSSMLTGCAVFIPLIFLSGISGALFYDQAVAVVVGHFASLLVSITIIPVYYKIIYRKGEMSSYNEWLGKINSVNYEVLYKKSFRFVIRNQLVVWSIVAGLLIGSLFLYSELPKSKLPSLTKNEILLSIDWNERISVEENNRRLQQLIALVGKHAVQNTCWVGEQQFLLDRNSDMEASESIIYFKTKTAADLTALQNSINEYFKSTTSDAIFAFAEADNVFNMIFPEEESPLIARLRPIEEHGPRQNEILSNTLFEIQKKFPEQQITAVSWQEKLVLKTNAIAITAYDIPLDAVYRKLKTAFGENEIFLIKDNQDFVPVVMGGKRKLIGEVLAQTYVSNRDGDLYPVRELVTEVRDFDLKTIVAGQEGEFIALDFEVSDKEASSLMDKLKSIFANNRFYEIDFKGSIFSNKELINEVTIILLVSIALLYCILAAQFESLTLPLIVLIEIPIAIFGALLFLKIFDSGINLMSMIGIVVMSGIIINDSILKVHTTNQLVNEGYSLIRALLVAGQRRLKPILMTSLVTVLAIVPMLFTDGLGNELQKPLALALIGGMVVGTAVSLYFIPLCYYYIQKRTTKKGVRVR